MIRAVLRWLTGGVLDRVLATVDRKVQAETDREKLKADIIMEAYRSRAGFMRSGGFVLMLLFALPVALWFAAVCVYSVFWCAGCAYPKGWSIAALPQPLDEWGWIIMLASMGLTATYSRK